MAKLATWLSRLKVFIKSLRGKPEGVDRAVFPYWDAYLGDGKWSQVDAQNLKAFFASSSGMRLRGKLHRMQVKSAIEGSKDQFHTVHSAGITAGVSSTIDHLYSLTYTFDKGPQTEQERQETAEQKEERELLERIGAL